MPVIAHHAALKPQEGRYLCSLAKPDSLEPQRGGIVRKSVHPMISPLTELASCTDFVPTTMTRRRRSICRFPSSRCVVGSWDTVAHPTGQKPPTHVSKVRTNPREPSATTVLDERGSVLECVSPPALSTRAPRAGPSVASFHIPFPARAAEDCRTPRPADYSVSGFNAVSEVSSETVHRSTPMLPVLVANITCIDLPPDALPAWPSSAVGAPSL